MSRNKDRSFKAKTLEQAIEKLKAGDGLTEKEASLCTKILSKKVVCDAVVDTSGMDGFCGGWKHVCPSCGAEVIPDGTSAVCSCGQMLRCQPFGEWWPEFGAVHMYNEEKEEWESCGKKLISPDLKKKRSLKRTVKNWRPIPARRDSKRRNNKKERVK